MTRTRHGEWFLVLVILMAWALALGAAAAADQPAYRFAETPKGLGYQDGIVQIFLDHLDEALKSLAK